MGTHVLLHAVRVYGLELTVRPWALVHSQGARRVEVLHVLFERGLPLESRVTAIDFAYERLIAGMLLLVFFHRIGRDGHIRAALVSTLEADPIVSVHMQSER